MIHEDIASLRELQPGMSCTLSDGRTIGKFKSYPCDLCVFDGDDKACTRLRCWCDAEVDEYTYYAVLSNK